MARQIIVLKQYNPNEGRKTWRICFWAAVPSARQRFYANPSFVSEFLDATTDETAALRSGSVVESCFDYTEASGATAGQSLSDLVARWNIYQASITALNQWSLYGSFYDGTTWTQLGVA